MSDPILVVDDNEDLRALLSELLSFAGWAVDVVRDGKGALERFVSNIYAVVLSDVEMPVLDGRALFRAIRERYPYYLDRLVFVSGGCDVEFECTLRHARVPLLQKPFSVDELGEVVWRTHTQSHRFVRGLAA